MKIKILNNWFYVNFEEKIIDEKGNNLYGKIDYETFQIKISEQYPISKIYETFFHEIIHGIDDTYKINLKEWQICILASSLLKLFHENENFLKEFRECLKKTITKK